MEDTILEMQKNLTEGLFIALVSTDKDRYYPITKPDNLSFLDDRRVLIRRKNGRHSIINLDLIVEISIMRGMM